MAMVGDGTTSGVDMRELTLRRVLTLLPPSHDVRIRRRVREEVVVLAEASVWWFSLTSDSVCGGSLTSDSSSSLPWREGEWRDDENRKIKKQEVA